MHNTYLSLPFTDSWQDASALTTAGSSGFLAFTASDAISTGVLLAYSDVRCLVIQIYRIDKLKPVYSVTET